MLDNYFKTLFESKNVKNITFHCLQQLVYVNKPKVLKDIWRHFTTGINYFRQYTETNNTGSEQNVCITWLQFRSCLRPCGTKVSSFIIQKSSSFFSLVICQLIVCVCVCVCVCVSYLLYYNKCLRLFKS